MRRAAFSPNIKERRDYSCAVFDGAGQVLAMGDHMPSTWIDAHVGGCRYRRTQA